jgi:hypothetical protein
MLKVDILNFIDQLQDSFVNNMKKIGIMNLPLHYGKAPRWLFERMVKLSREIVLYIVTEFGNEEFLKKISDPLWFQAFGAVLGFDWHSSGITTTVCGALKEALKDIENEIGIFVAGGKGKTSLKTPDEIILKCEKTGLEPSKLIYTSKIVAKIDNTAVQDNFQLYHHTFIFTNKGDWTVVQQGLNQFNHFARRYHWLSFDVKEFVNEPHKAICCDIKEKNVLNMVSAESSECREVSVLVSNEKPEKILNDIEKIKEYSMPKRHSVDLREINSERLYKIFLKTYETKPQNFEQLLAIEGVGPKTIRALALISELIYGKPPSYNDPVRFSFAHGGKDGHPYPVDKETYDKSIEILKKALEKIKLNPSEKNRAIKTLFDFYNS